MAAINKPSQPLIPPTDVEEVEEIATNVAEAAIAADDTHAPLVDDKVPAANLPSYVDDVLNFDSVDEFPEEGEEGKIYVANDTNLTYRWSGVAYIQVGGASLAAGNGIDIENDIVSVDMDYVGNNLDHVTETELAEGLATKQDSISDLDTIRSGAAAGATAIQPADVANKLFDGVFEFTDSVGDMRQIVGNNSFKELMSSLAVGEYIYKIICTGGVATDQGIAYITISNGVFATIRDCKIFDARRPHEPVRIIAMRKNENGWFTDANDLVMSYNSNAFSQLRELWDTTPTTNSTHPVTSGGVKTALDAKADASSVYTKSEVDSAIAAAIGNVLNEEF